MQDDECYNVAAQIVMRLRSVGNTTVKRCLNRNLKTFRADVIRGAVTCRGLLHVIKELLELETNSKWQGEILEKAWLYLVALDYATDNLESDMLSVHGGALLKDTDALNTEFRDHVEIYRTFPGVDRNKISNEDYTCAFKNLIFYCKDDNEFYERLKIDNVYITQSDGKAFSKFRIGFVPFTNTECAPYVEEDNRIFGICKTQSDAYDNRFIQTCDMLFRKGECDMVFGPEMHGSRYLDDMLYNLFRYENCKAIFCPSYYKSGSRVENSAKLYAKQEQHNLQKQVDKCHPAEFSNGKVEAITSKDEYHVSLLHVKGIGRILCLICKDAITQDFSDLIGMLNVDVLVVQCYTPTLTDFLEYAAKYSYKRCIIIGNSCHAVHSSPIEQQGYLHPLTVIHYNPDHTQWERSWQEEQCYCKTKTCEEMKCIKIVVISTKFEEITVCDTA